MDVYKTTKDFGEVKAGTILRFDKNSQCFESFNGTKYITNNQSAKNPGLITICDKIHKEKVKRKVIVIPY